MLLLLAALRLAAGRAEGLGLLAANLLVARSVLALEVEVLADRVVEQAHRAEAYRETAAGWARSTRFLPPRFAR